MTTGSTRAMFLFRNCVALVVLFILPVVVDVPTLAGSGHPSGRSPAARGSAASFTPLGNLDPLASPAGSFANGISADGTTVVGASYFRDSLGTQTRGFVWSRNTGMKNLGLPPGGLASSSAMRVSNDGKSAVGATGFTIDGYLEIRNGLAFRVSDPKPKGLVVPAALSINDITADGSIVVGATRVPAPYPIIDRAFYKFAASGELFELGILPGGSYSAASAVSSDGTVIAGYADTPSSITATRWTRSTGLTELAGQPPGVPSQASGISADGTVIVGNLNDEAFLWTEHGQFSLLGKLSDSGFAMGLDASADGSTVVGYNYTDTGLVAFVWDRVHGMRGLVDALTAEGIDLAGWELNSATGISDNGRIIAGFGINPAGEMEGFVASLPE